ncbi:MULTISPECIES: hypothetical protein [Streptacidiphilus]|uniref:Uncharacterized protein n=1 Tax=Streptacidiphilus cavernicola TaxID=3342716 RepID=A0ABV6UGT8_9ACTN|nr:hypothetical protein [Streptacidiphilus jeojiense]
MNQPFAPRGPRALLLQRVGVLPGFPFLVGRDPRAGVSPDDPMLALSQDVAEAVRAWCATPGDGKRGVTAALGFRVAADLGPGWMLGVHDELHGSTHLACWHCGAFHWHLRPHPVPKLPRVLQVKGQYAHGPLRAERFGDFSPDEPTAGLQLTPGLVDDFYAWSQAVNHQAQYGTADGPELDARGAALADRLATELGHDWTVEYLALEYGNKGWM